MLGHESLRVYQHAIQLCACAGEILEEIPKRMSVHDQFDRASTSICLNIAEGAGKFTARDQARFYDIARGSALECAACLAVAVVRRIVSDNRVADGKRKIEAIVNMLVGLVRANDPERKF